MLLAIAGDKIMVLVHARVKPKDSTEWHETRWVDLFTFHNGKATPRRALAGRGRPSNGLE